MNWPDERYVKLYVRDTANWQMLPWQSKALLPLLLRKFDGAGIMDTGKHDKTRAVALIVGIPAEVVGPGLDGLIADGVVQHIDGGLVCPNFIDSQEACKTEAQKKRDQRQRVKDQRMATQRVELTSTPVPLLSRAVPFLSPSSPAQPSPAQIKDLVVSAPPKQTHPLQEVWNANKASVQPKWVETNAERKRKADARWRERSPEQWVEVVRRIAASRWCLGDNDRAWKAGPEFLLKPNTATRVLEGEFDSKQKPKPAAHPYNPNAVRMDS